MQQSKANQISLDSYYSSFHDDDDDDHDIYRSSNAPLLKNHERGGENRDKSKEQSREAAVNPGVIVSRKNVVYLVLVFLVLLFSESARGIVLPTLSPFVKKLGGNNFMLGLAVGAFSLGRFTSTILLGYLSTKLSYKIVLTVSVMICVLGNLLYGISEDASNGIYVLLVARVITGFGAGTLSVIRAYVAHVSSAAERTKYMSILGAVQFLGFAITPALGSAIVYLPQFYIGGAVFNKYNEPGYLLAICNLALFVALIAAFKNPPPKEPVPVTSIQVETPSTTAAPTPSAASKKWIYIYVAIFLTLNLLVRLILGIIETVATPIYVELSGKGEDGATEAGLVFGGLGFIGMFILFGISYLSKRVSDFTILICGLSATTIGAGIMIGDIGLPRFIIGAGLIWCIGYPLAQTIIVSMFSKLIGDVPQGTYMGWIGTMGSLGRIIGPFVAGLLYERIGQSETMIFGAAVSLLSVLIVIPLYKGKISL